MPLVPKPYDVLFEHLNHQSGSPEITVVITNYKYGKECIEALESLKTQTEDPFNIYIVDDASPDDSVEIISAWLEKNKHIQKFAKLLLIRHKENQGLSLSRNTGISLVETPYVFILDADNQIYPSALSKLKNAIKSSGLPAAYSLIELFGEVSGIINNSIWVKEKFQYGNYIDAMALFKTEIFHELDGYRKMPHNFGWEDYDFWLKMIDSEYRACYVPNVLCRYRIHSNSMLRTLTNRYVSENKHIILEDLNKHHKIKITL